MHYHKKIITGIPTLHWAKNPNRSKMKLQYFYCGNVKFVTKYIYNFLVNNKTFPHHNYSYLVFVLYAARCKGQKTSRLGIKNLHKQISQRQGNIRATFWSDTYVWMGPTVFTTCVSWTLTHNPILRRHRRGLFRMLQRRWKYVPGVLPQVTWTLSTLSSLRS